MSSSIDLVKNSIKEHFSLEKKMLNLESEIMGACKICAKAIVSGNKIILMGNGGSAADAQHIAAEFVGRFVKERIALPSIALTTDISIITAIGNDYGFDNVFSRQLDALCNKGDVVIGISTSGNSKNVIEGIKSAKKKGGIVISFSGRSGGLMKEMSDYSIIVPSEITARIQEMHILIGHILCEYVDEDFIS